jgi:transcriptional regulator with XRE-family HTH domain
LKIRRQSQTWLAAQLDLDFVTLTRYVNNHRQPDIVTLFEIARVLKVNPRRIAQ